MASDNDSNKAKSKADINTATYEDIASLPFMNTQRARLIVDYREANGAFENIEQIDNVPGIGERLSNLVAQHFEVKGGRKRG